MRGAKGKKGSKDGTSSSPLLDFTRFRARLISPAVELLNFFRAFSPPVLLGPLLRPKLYSMCGGRPRERRIDPRAPRRKLVGGAPDAAVLLRHLLVKVARRVGVQRPPAGRAPPLSRQQLGREPRRLEQVRDDLEIPAPEVLLPPLE